MFESFRCKLNLLQYKKYKKNIGNITISNGKTESLCNVEPTDTKVLDEYFIQNKKKNAKNYAKTSAINTTAATFTLIIPIVALLSFDTLLFKESDKYTLPKYAVTTTVLEDGVATSQYKETAYYNNTGDAFIPNEDVNVIPNTDNEIICSMNGINSSIEIKMKITDDNKIELQENGIKDEYYLTGSREVEDKTDQANFETPEDSTIYSNLFDDVFKYLSHSTDITQEQKAIINELSNEEKTEIVIKVIEKVYESKDEPVDGNVSLGLLLFAEGFISVVGAIIIRILYGVIYKSIIRENFKVNLQKHGSTVIGETKGCSSVFEQISLNNEKLIEAETKRICESVYIAYRKGLKDEDIKKLLTKYETKIFEEYTSLKKEESKKLVRKIIDNQPR